MPPKTTRWISYTAITRNGKRDLYGLDFNKNNAFTTLPQNLNPIEVDSIHGSGRFSLTDRVKFAFNYLQDTWSGATPLGTAPAVSGAFTPQYELNSKTGKYIITGASPLALPGSTIFFSKDLRNIYQSVSDPILGIDRPGPKNNQLTQVLSYASPETRKQGDFKLSYQWDEAALDIGGGISIENDYESRFGNIGGRFDFNQKNTTVNWGLSYTNSETTTHIDPDAIGLNYIDITSYQNTNLVGEYINDKFVNSVKQVKPAASAGYIESLWDLSNPDNPKRNGAILHGNRQDWGTQLGLSQVLGKNDLLALDFGYTRSTGYLGNPYKVVYGLGIKNEIAPYDNPKVLDPTTGTYSVVLRGILENRPAERNLFNWHLGYNKYVEMLDAALHFNYSFAHDDWGINAHTFEADWMQPLGAGWTVTPRIRYYSQSAADFYTHFFFPSVEEPIFDNQGQIIGGKNFKPIPTFYSSDQRLSGFGTLSGGVTVEKKFAKGVSVEAGFEYYTHQGGLKIGGGGEDAFADYDFWVANAELKVNLASVGMGGDYAGHGGHQHHSNSPAGVMFDHALPKAGDFMAGYRFMRSEQAGDMLFGSHSVGLDTVKTIGCDNKPCAVTPDFMAMSMHMLDLMYAPTDWLTLMLMPQWMDMEMTMTPNDNFQFIDIGHGGHSTTHAHQTGSIGDFGAYALFKVFEHPNHHLTVSLGGTVPTSDVDIVLRKTAMNPVYDQKIHYGMQLGSGIWDFKPALTYTGEMDNFLWGAQANATIRLEDSNDSGFAFGDIFQGSVWGGYNWTNWLATTVRGVYTSQGKIDGAYPPVAELDFDGVPTGKPYSPQHIGPFDLPGNYGGQFVDLGLGVNVTLPSGAFQGNTLKFE